MIISASRRTDIPALYPDWLMQRLREGYALVKNPRNPQRCSRVNLAVQAVDCIVFWTKNAAPLLPHVPRISAMGYPFYVQFTVTAYGQDVERHVPPKAQVVDTFKRLSDTLGPSRVIWRYDPVFLSRAYPLQRHMDIFGALLQELAPYTQRCIFSFIDRYRRIQHSIKDMVYADVHSNNMCLLAAGFAQLAQEYTLPLQTCSEEVDLQAWGIGHGACIDKELIETLVGYKLDPKMGAKKDANQRPVCRCVEAQDLGEYDSCTHGCRYCYATTSDDLVAQSVAQHDPLSPLVSGQPNPDWIITERPAHSLRMRQLSLFS